MLFAGHDTGAHTIMRIFSELPRHCHVWDKLVAEQQEVPLPADITEFYTSILQI